MRAIRDYEEKVKFLNNERERYKKVLVNEYSKLSNTVRESIKKFNIRLADLFFQKLKVESAIQEETLKINRIRYNCYLRFCLLRTEKDAE